MPGPDAPATAGTTPATGPTAATGPDAVWDRLRALAAEQLGVDLGGAGRDALLVEDLGVDSLALTELAMALEDSYAVELPEDQLAGVETLGDLETLVRDRAGG